MELKTAKRRACNAILPSMRLTACEVSMAVRVSRGMQRKSFEDGGEADSARVPPMAGHEP